MACRGTGRVISNLGGAPSTVDCPWCAGSGLRPAEIDAQAHWGASAADGSDGAGEPPAALAGDGGEQAQQPAEPSEPAAS
jgi:hypothetical protein